MMANRPRFTLRCIVALTLLAGACAAPPPTQQRPLPPPKPRPVMTQHPVVQPLPHQQPQQQTLPLRSASTDWRDMAQTPGTWTWSMDGPRSTARYGVAGAAPVAMMRCDPASQIVTLWRAVTPGSAPAGTQVALVVNTTGTRKILTAQADGAGGVHVALAPRDPLLDEIAFSRGRFMLESPSITTLYLPSWPELSRVIEDCR